MRFTDIVARLGRVHLDIHMDCLNRNVSRVGYISVTQSPIRNGLGVPNHIPFSTNICEKATGLSLKHLITMRS